VVLDINTWKKNLPYSVEAVFYISNTDKQKAHTARQAFLSKWPQLSENDLPLVKFDPTNFEAPFSGPTSS
jgi:hypothetical protein